MTALTCLAVSDFNLSNLAALLGKDEELPRVELRRAPAAPPAATLLDRDGRCWQPEPDCALIWTRPQAVIEGFRRALEGHTVGLEELHEEVDAYAAAVLAARDRTATVLVPTWVDPPYERGDALLDLEPGLGAGDLLAEMNRRLAHRLTTEPGFFVLNAGRWVARVGLDSFQPRMWYLAKCPFGKPLLEEAAAEIKAALAAITGRSRKLLILDLDDTLWGGLVGEVGLSGLRLGGHDHEGEALVDFQRRLKALTRRGVLLAIVSKNDERVALEAIRQHPEMVLALDDFVGWRINWRDKAANVAELTADLGLGLDSVVFIDDSPAERARVAEALPAVYVPDWPADKTLYPRRLAELRCFDKPSRATAEDRNRTRMYAEELERRESRAAVGSLDEWLQTLGTTVTVEPLSEINLDRASQLLNKTNQMNLATRRLPKKELRDWSAEPRHHFWTLTVEDRLGSAGLTGLLSLERRDGEARIVDFVLSCRVIGRRLEALAVELARRLDAERLSAELVPTERNGPCREFWQRSGFSADADGLRFSWQLEREYPRPDGILVVGVEDS